MYILREFCKKLAYMIEGGWLSGWNFWAGVKAAATDEISSSIRETSALLLGPFNGLNQAPSYYIG